MAQNANAAAEAQVAAIAQGPAQNANVTAEAQAEAIVQGAVNAENNAATIATLRPFQRFFHTIVGLTRTQCISVASDAYEDFMDFENIHWDNI